MKNKRLRSLVRVSIILVCLLIMPFKLGAIDIEHKWNEEVKVALVLSGGGARGFAHIPIIEALERHNIPIDMVVGTSMGALVGGMYAAGYSPKDMRELIASYDMVELFAVSPASFQKPIISSFADHRDNIFNLTFDTRGIGKASGLIGDQKILEMLNSALVNTSSITNFNHLPIPFRCVGTNLVTGEEVVFSSGSLVKSIRASISIPGIFSPAIVKEELIIDGGLVNNLPIDVAKEMGADIIIAVDVNAVDYTVTKDDLNSLVSILGQLAIILTKNTVVDQIPEAHLLFSPLVEDYGILAFPSFKEIMMIGEACALEMEEKIAALSEEICAMRECSPVNPDRKGSYFYLPEIEIDKVVFTPVEKSSLGLRDFPIKKYYKFSSSFLGKETLDDLHFLLNEEKELNQYETVSYSLSNIRYNFGGLPHGILNIHAREFEQRNNSFGIGVFGSTTFTYSPDSNFSFFFNPNFTISFHSYKFIIPNLEFSFNVAEKDFLEITSDIAYTWADSYRLGVLGRYQRGTLHAFDASNPSLTEYGADHYVAPVLFFEYLASPYTTGRISAEFESVWYRNNDSTFTSLNSTSITFSGVHAYQKFTLFPARGTRIDLLGTLFIDNKIGYKANIRVKQAFPLGYNDSLLIDLKAGSTHSVSAHVDDYFSYGGFDGIITIPSSLIVKDMIIGGLSYFHWFVKSPIPVVLKTSVRVGFQGKEASDIYQGARYEVETSPSIDFSHDIDLVGTVGLGFSIRNTDLLFGFALDNNLNAALFVEVR
ncbi:MAG: hypothetical protein EOM67_02465 [Spirochaetia bacterium]|nr:hypothetical protein [Spirochaetia bacterium]